MDFEKRAAALLAKDDYNVYDLVELVSLLRSENGCPWDKVQTHSSIRRDLIEETYEVAEAIDCGSESMLREELGDLLLQVVFHADIEKDKGTFDIDDVANEVCRKLILRHPHVFGNVKADTVDKVISNWDSIKMDEKKQDSFSDTLRSVPKTLPALMRAQKLGKRAAKARCDFQNGNQGALDSLDVASDELCGLRTAIESNADEQNAKEAFGDFMFACCTVAGTLGIDAEEALGEACARFVGRFEKAEAENGKMSDLGFGDYDTLWRKQ